MAKQMEQGKAFEYACLISLYNALKNEQDIHIEDTAAVRTARNCYENEIESAMRDNLNKAAMAAVKILKRLEPQLEYANGNEPMYLSIQSDDKGQDGDVRDVLCIRLQNEWEIGLSCKHNHSAVKHSRLSGSLNFGDKWFGYPCDKQYFADIADVFANLQRLKDNNCNWDNVANKAETVYEPVLNAFIKELKRLDAVHPGEIPKRLVQYLIGNHDFYKVISDDNHRTVKIEAVNIYGTLNRASGKVKPLRTVQRMILPTQFYRIGFKHGSNNTVEVICDGGWNISMRIHNAKKEVEPSLKFDVQLMAIPLSILAQEEPYDE